MRKLLAATCLASMPVAFANAKPAAAPETSPAADANTVAVARKAGAPALADRIAPLIAAPRTDVPLPVKASGTRGAPSPYSEQLSKLEVGQSIGITNKSKKQLSSVVSVHNRRGMVHKTDAAGALLFEMTEMKDANGTKIGETPDTTKPVMIAGKHFVAYDVDPKADPDKATARIFRDA